MVPITTKIMAEGLHNKPLSQNKRKKEKGKQNKFKNKEQKLLK
jgi:hypothetical protein